jgi:putative ABC transport system permease protein
MKRRSRHPLNPSICGLRISALFALYRRHLRSHAVAELLAGSGIAVGVALVFGVLVANSSILDSAREIIHAVDGTATLELAARSPHGFSDKLAERAAGLPGVQNAALLLRENAVLEGPRGRAPVQLVGVTAGLVRLGGSATRNLGAGALLLSGGIGLPSGVAGSIGAQTASPVTLIANGAAHTAQVRAVLDAGAIGGVSASGVAVALLPYAQRFVGEPGRVTDVLIRPARGSEKRVVRELRTLAGGRADVVPADNELRLVETAAKPTSQSTALFAAISVMVGFLFALNAMLLTVPERRRAVADMRVQGYDSRQVLLVLGFQALVLGLCASLVGVLAGDVLARTLFHEVPGYLAATFPISGHQTIRLTVVFVAFGCGVLATLLASMAPIFDLRPSQPVDAVLHRPGEPGQSIGRATAGRAAALGSSLVVLVTALVLLAPDLTVIGGVALALAALCMIPLLFRLGTGLLTRFARRYHGGMLAVASIELDATATRSVALAGIAALAIYGSTAVGGARTDLIHGLDRAIVQTWSTGDVWVTPDENSFDVHSFNAGGRLGVLARSPAVTSVRAHQGGFLADGSHRLWIRASPPDNSAMVQSSQLLEGDLEQATARLRENGWAAVSSGFAGEHHLHVGGSFTLPTPSGPARFAVAAITTNIGWPSGTITMNTSDYGRYWQTTDPTTVAVTLKTGISPEAGKRAVEAALGHPPGLRVQTSRERIAEVERSTSQGLNVLSEIAILLLVAAAFALAAALSTAIYQRRVRLASLKAQGFDRFQLWRSLLMESVVVVGIGCVDGAILGLYGHALADRYLRLSTGFPAPFGIGEVQMIATLLVICGISLAVVALPGYAAAGVSPRVSFQE